MNYPYAIPYRLDKPRIMIVTGIGSILVKPTIASIHLEVITENINLTQAHQENAAKMNRVIRALLDLGISRENIQTTRFNIHPMYDFIDGKQVFRGYQVANTISVKMSHFDQIGIVIDTAVKNGVNQVSNIQFGIDDIHVFYQQALRAALENAREKAQTIAETMQLDLHPNPLRIIEIIKESPSTLHAMAFSEASFTTPIEPGQIKIDAIVTVHFQY